MGMIIILAVLANVILFGVSQVVAINAEKEGEKREEIRRKLEIQQAHARRAQESAKAQEKNSFESSWKVTTDKQKKEFDRKAALKWLKNNADFIQTNIDKCVDCENQRSFVIPGGMMNSLSDKQKSQVALFLLEGYVYDINEAVLDKEGNINCYYYLG